MSAGLSFDPPGEGKVGFSRAMSGRSAKTVSPEKSQEVSFGQRDCERRRERKEIISGGKNPPCILILLRNIPTPSRDILLGLAWLGEKQAEELQGEMHQKLEEILGQATTLHS
ncbi:hypothetical protein AMECASPLE_003288 [Ameca splendens]|uniref:Uncharacterized protein n=1 Tax=Ameca splendens TaxID=208324 RepID=A0ABV0XYD3_9TELE